MSSGKTIGLIKALGGTGGGGGGTSDAVQYIPQELTESQQMQARKNLALPYKMTGDVEILPKQTFDFNTTGFAGTGVYMPIGFRLIAGKTYMVTYDGETFEGVALSHEIDGVGSAAFIGGNDYGFENWPVKIWCPQDEYVATDMANKLGDHELTVVEKDSEVIMPLQQEFSPKGIVLYNNAQTNELSCNLPLEKCLEYFNGAFLLRQGGFPNVTLLLVHPSGMWLIVPGQCAKDRYVSEDENKDVSECLLFAFTLPDGSVLNIQYSVDGLEMM